MNALTARALAALPADLQTQARQHCRTHVGDRLDDLISELWLSLAVARPSDTQEIIFKRARSATRRFTQDISHFSRALDEDEAIENQNHCESETFNRADITREIADQEQITKRAAQYRIKKQIERAKHGDLFAIEVPA